MSPTTGAPLVRLRSAQLSLTKVILVEGVRRSSSHSTVGRQGFVRGWRRVLPVVLPVVPGTGNSTLRSQGNTGPSPTSEDGGRFLTAAAGYGRRVGTSPVILRMRKSVVGVIVQAAGQP